MAVGFEAMARKGRPPGSGKSERDDQAIKVDRVIVGKLKAIATHRGITVAELASELLRSPTDREYAKVLRELEGRN